jgi:glycosyltransferase involved in cell wall biosynthesis
MGNSLQSPSVWATRFGTASMPNPCAYYRILLPFAELQKHGWDTRCSPSEETPPAESEQADVFVMESGDRPEAAAILRERAKFQRLVYETDDDYFSLPPAIKEAYAKYIHPEARQAIINNMRACHTVTVTTEPLAASIRKHTGHPDVRVVPNRLPDEVLCLAPFHRPRRTVIGWTGSGSRDADFAVVASAVRSVLERVKRTEMHFMGTDYRYMLPRHLPTRHTHPIAISLDTLGWFRGYDFDIALAPLADIPFNRSRSALKSLEAMALGIPVLASDTEPYRGIVIDGVNGYLCRPRDWAKRLRELACDRQTQEEMGRAARETAREHVISAHWQDWARVYADRA